MTMTLIADIALAVTVVLGLGSVAALVLRRASPAAEPAPREPLPIAAILLSLWGAAALVASLAFARDANALRALLAEGACRTDLVCEKVMGTPEVVQAPSPARAVSRRRKPAHPHNCAGNYCMYAVAP